MSPKRVYSFMIEPDLAEALKAAKQREPELSEGAIIRQALREWLERHQPKPSRKRMTKR